MVSYRSAFAVGVYESENVCAFRSLRFSKKRVEEARFCSSQNGQLVKKASSSSAQDDLVSSNSS